jgi:triosephosphate isomerase (TIM)
MTRPIIIAGNWKMNKTRSESKELAEAVVSGISGKSGLPTVVLCPTFIGLETVVAAAKGSPVAVGAQNMYHQDSGAFTGEIAPPMLTDIGVKYVLIGHSERRQFFGETNSSVNLKLKAALTHNLVPIVCVGETIDERESNLTDAVVSRQVAAAVNELDGSQLKTLVIAYEPVWAIGTGKVCDADEANRVCKLIRSTISNLYNDKARGEAIPILYGGSVNPSCVDEQLAQSDIDGSLVGGASLKADQFLSLVESGCRALAGAAK